MNVQDFQLWEMRSRDAIDVKRCYIDAAGDLLSGVLLSQIIYWHLPNPQGESKLRVRHDDYDWLAKKRDDWWIECRITPKQFDRAIEILEDKKLVVTKLFRFAGSPTKHIRLNWDGVFDALKALTDNVFPQRSKSNLPKGENGNLPNGKLDIDETGRTYTEITPETTTEITPETTPPIPPEEKKGEEAVKACEVEILDPTPAAEVEQTKGKQARLYEQINPDMDDCSAAASKNTENYRYKRNQPEYPKNIDGSDRLPWEIPGVKGKFNPQFEKQMARALVKTSFYQKLMPGELVTHVRKHISAGKHNPEIRDKLWIEWEAMHNPPNGNEPEISIGQISKAMEMEANKQFIGKAIAHL